MTAPIAERARATPPRRDACGKNPVIAAFGRSSAVSRECQRNVKAHERAASLLKGLLRVVPVLLATNAFAINPYPGEGQPVIGASLIASGGDVKATFIVVVPAQ